MAKPGIKVATRQVTSRFWENADLADLERTSGIRNLRLTMIGLWAVADEVGIFEWVPRRLAGKIYPYNSDDQQAVEPAMNAFVEAGFLKKLEVGGSWYGVWPHWGEHNSFRSNVSRYPEVAEALGYPSQGGGTPRKGARPLDSPLEREVEEEGEVEVSLPVSMTEQEKTKQGGTGENPSAERLAKLLFKLLDEPRDQIQNAGAWESLVSSLLRTHQEDEVANVMEFAVKDNDFSAEYLTVAKEPMKSFVKNYDGLHKRWKALQKGAAAAANRAAKLKPGVTAPGAHGNKSGMEL